jgi:nucleoside-diphosphate-sugar epimerase
MRVVVVTGESGKGGRWVVRELLGHGHDVLNVDLVLTAARTGNAWSPI